MAAALNGDAVIGRSLLAKKADIQATDAAGSTTLIYAAANGHRDFLQLLLDAGLKDGVDLALAFAANACESATIDALLKGGAKTTEKVRGAPVIMLAASKGCNDTVALLLSRGADVNARADDGTTALMAAALQGFPAVAQTLIDHGADIDAENQMADTAELMAIKGRNPEIADLIRKARDRK
jgi:ankyrin repeat protein